MVAWMSKYVSLEKYLFAALLLVAVGLVYAFSIIVVWAKTGFGVLAQERSGLVSLMLVSMGITSTFGAFLTSMLQIHFRGDK
jgi:hypothetical protein